MLVTAPHSTRMAAAVARADAAGWFGGAGLPADYRGPVDQPYRPFATILAGRTAVDCLAALAAQAPDLPAFADRHRSLDAGGLWRAVRRLATRLLPLPPGPVAVLLPSGVALPVGVLACRAAGRVALLLDPGHPAAWIAARLREGAAVAVVTEGTADEAHGLPRIAAEQALDGDGAIDLPRLPTRAQDPAFVLHTSGSTGAPCALAYAEAAILQQVEGLVDGLHLSRTDRLLLVTSGATIAGLFSLFVTLAGSQVRFAPVEPGGLDALRTALREGGATVLRGVPSLLRLIARLPDATTLLAGLRAVRSTGEALLQADVALLRRVLPPGCVILNGYGATEISGATWFAREGDAHDPLRVAAGLLDAGTQARILDEAGRPCAPGETGELWLRGRHAALGEWVGGRVVPGRLVPDAADPSLRAFRTGDLARLAPDGALVVLGRRDRMVKAAGMRVEPAEAEAALHALPGVAAAAVIAAGSAERPLLVGFVVPAQAPEADLPARLKAALRAVLPTASVPARLVCVPAIPLLPGGKRDEAALLRVLDAG